MDKSIIYRATSKTSGKEYIGQSLDTLDGVVYRHRKQSFGNGPGATSHFHRAIKKYGPEDFTWMIIGEAVGQLEADTLERYYIKVYRAYTEGYNLTEGGKLHFKHSPETRAKISKAGMGNKNANGNTPSKETLEKRGKAISKAKKGKPWSEAQQEAHSDRKPETGYRWVEKNGKGFLGRYSENGKRINCGTYPTAKEAHEAVLEKKETTND